MKNRLLMVGIGIVCLCVTCMAAEGEAYRFYRFKVDATAGDGLQLSEVKLFSGTTDVTRAVVRLHYDATTRGANKKCEVRIAAHAAILKFDRRVALRSAMPAAFLCRQCIPASLHRAATSVLQADSIMPDPM